MDNIVYTYEHAPTLKAFSKDRTRIRGVMGPIGSGKSSACVMELIKLAQQQKPAKDGVRYTRFLVVRNCYDDQTEILTEKRGFQLFKDLSPDDKVATLEGDNIVYKLPQGVAIHDYEGEMLGFHGENVDFLVTPEHKMWVSARRTRKKQWSDFEVKTAEEIYGSELIRVRKDAYYEANNEEFDEDFYELFGFMLAEGSCDLHGQIIISSNTKGSYTTDLLRKNGIDYTIRDNGRQYYVLKSGNKYNRIYSLFSPLGKSYEKYIPGEIKNGSTAQLKKLIDGFAEGDGNVYRGTTRLYTSSKRLADDLQEICVRSGLAANVAQRDRVGKKLLINGVKTKVNHVEYIVTLLSQKKHRPVLRGDKKKTGWYKLPYNGKVYCVEMEEIPVCVRRKGKTLWCLRSYP